MSDSVTKKRKVSKKNKKSWRKHVDIQDVEKYLEDVRLEERLGTPHAKRKDEELFAIDICPSAEFAKAIQLRVEKQLNAQKKEPRCFALLQPHTAVQDPISKRNRVRTREERKHPALKRKELFRKTNNILTLKEKVALHNKNLAATERKNRFKRGEFKEDIWAIEDAPPSELNIDWMSSDSLRHTLTNLRKKKMLKTSLSKKNPSILPAVEVPHPGSSYNPTYEDHQNLLTELCDDEKKIMKEEAHLNRVTTKMFKKVTQEEIKKTAIEEQKDILKFIDTNNENKPEDDDPTVKSVNPPVENRKKTLKARRKQKEQKEMASDRIKQKVEKKKIADIYKLKKIDKSFNTKAKKEEMLQKLREKNKQRKALEPKTLSRFKFKPSNAAFQLPSEIKGNLRSTAPTGNLLKERFKSLQQRNIIAPTALILKRTKGKIKKFEKAEHKINLKDVAVKYKS